MGATAISYKEVLEGPMKNKLRYLQLEKESQVATSHSSEDGFV